MDNNVDRDTYTYGLCDVHQWNTLCFQNAPNEVHMLNIFQRLMRIVQKLILNFMPSHIIINVSYYDICKCK
uniref:Uncharacterized protein n=1 Tax=Schistosoma mansoni TaxID=6183 RepID=A0A5K4F975_SCHMA